MSTYLNKDRKTPRIVSDSDNIYVSKCKKVECSTVCRYCDTVLSLESPMDRQHLERYCSAVNVLVSPLRDIAPSIDLVARRMAGLTRVRRLHPVRFAADRDVT